MNRSGSLRSRRGPTGRTAHRSPGLESLERRLALAGDVVISEFLAQNDGGAGALLDEDGDSSDWIELHNASTDPLDVAGYYLTDDPLNLTKWQLPSRTLAVDERMVIFASGKDRTAPQWHANFQLDQAGEYLALVKADGTTIASEFAPAYPDQVGNISYGILNAVRTNHALVTEASQMRFLSPSDDSLGSAWTDEAFDDSAWPLDARGAEGAQPVGFDADFQPGGGAGPWIDGITRGGSSANAAPTLVTGGLLEDALSFVDRAHQYNGVDAVNTIAATGLSGADFVRVANNDRNVADYSLTVSVLGTVDLYLLIDNRIGDNVAASGPTLGGAVMPWVLSMGFVDTGFDIGIDGNGDGVGPGVSIQDFASIYKKSDVTGSIVLGAQNDTSAGGPTGRNMYGVAARASSSGPTIFVSQIQTDVQGQMYADHASAYLRSAFGFAGGGDLESLTLKAKYDDGFVAYLNGTEVARRNAPGAPGTPPAFDAAATGSRPDTSAVVFEDIDVTAFGNLLLTGGSNVLAVQALNEAAADADFFMSFELHATTVVTTGQTQYFTTPTPGAANVPGFLGFVADTKFAGEPGVFHDAGFYSAPFDVTLTTATPGAEIRYTTNGSPPTAATGAVYTAPIHVTGTTTLRAAAFKPGYQATNVDTQTYLFLDQVLQQNGAGLPPYAAWGHAGADWAVDPDVVNHADPNSRVTTADLQAVPTLSMVLDWNDMFGSGGQGIYIQGAGVERGASLEWIHPDGSRGFSVNASVEIQGGTSDDRWKDDKLSMQVKFHQPYGPAKLDYDVFGGDATESFDTLILDGVLNWSWVHTTSAEQRAGAKYIQDQFVADLQNSVAGYAPHGRFAHLYINGLYWGMYYVHERPDKTFNSDYQGGDKDEWNVVKHNANTIVDNALTNPVGTTATTDFNAMLALANADLSVDANYQALAARLDIDNFIDYLLVNWYAGNDDWPAKNWYASAQAAPGGKWRFHSWDAEHVLKDVNVNRVGQSPHGLHNRLALNAGYRQLLADHVQRHFFDDGVLTPARAAAAYQTRMAEIDAAIRGESARWGDNSETVPRTRANWLATQSGLLTNYFPNRTNNVVNQLRTAGLFPAVGAPTFSQLGGTVSAGFQLTLTDPNAPPGTIYYTTDGSEPSQPITVTNTTLLAEFAPARALVPSVANGGSALGTSWREPGFDDGSWTSGNAGVGYDTNTAGVNFNPLIGINVQAGMLSGNTTVYVRQTFNVDDPAAFTSLTLNLKYDDGFAAYLNGFEVARNFAPAVLAWNSASAGGNSDANAIVFQPFDITAHLNRLVAGTNVLAIHGLNASTSSSDALFLPQLIGSATSGSGVSPTAQEYTAPITLSETSTVKARIRRGTTWSALAERFFTVETPVRITEVNYHPGPRSAAEITAGFTDDDDFEFIELQNISPTDAVNLDGAALVDGVQWTFGGVTLAPGQFAVVVRNQAAFQFRYGASPLIAGVYGGTIDNYRLSNNGEGVTLHDAGGGVIQSFDYDDDAPWPLPADGAGPTLVLVDPLAGSSSWTTAAGWRASCETGGSPGAADPLLCGWVFDDDGDGVQEAGEAGHADVGVELYRVEDDGQGGFVYSAVASASTNAEGVYRFLAQPAGNYLVQFAAPAGWQFGPLDQGGDDALDSDADSSGQTAHFALSPSQADSSRDAALVPAPAAVVERWVFYNNSVFDGNDPAAGAGDDAALAGDKSALLPGQTASLANYTSFSKGINGVMIDVANLAGTPTAADFAFRTGNNNSVASWDALAIAPSVTVRPGAGAGGSDRITLVWPDGAVAKRWLQVTLLAANTGLAADDVFYFGNAVGEIGNATGDAVVNATDEIGARTHPVGPFPTAAVTNLYDFNRDRLVNATDQIIARTNGTNPLTALRLIAAPAAAGSGGAADAALAGLTIEASPSGALRRRRR